MLKPFKIINDGGSGCLNGKSYRTLDVARNAITFTYYGSILKEKDVVIEETLFEIKYIGTASHGHTKSS